MAEWLKAAVLKTVEPKGSVGSNPTPSAMERPGEMAESAEGARLLSECGGKLPPRVRIPLSPPFEEKARLSEPGFFCAAPPSRGRRTARSGAFSTVYGPPERSCRRNRSGGSFSPFFGPNRFTG